MKKIARELAEQKPENAWAHVRLIYDGFETIFKYTRGDMKDTVQTLKDKTGDCEEMTSLFVALCRVVASRHVAYGFLVTAIPSSIWKMPMAMDSGFPVRQQVAKVSGRWPTICRSCRRAIALRCLRKKWRSNATGADYLTSKKLVGQQKPKVEFIGGRCWRCG